MNSQVFCLIFVSMLTLPELLLLLLLLGTWLEPRAAMYSHCRWSDLSQRHAPKACPER
jgi:hypothetical protein